MGCWYLSCGYLLKKSECRSIHYFAARIDKYYKKNIYGGLLDTNDPPGKTKIKHMSQTWIRTLSVTLSPHWYYLNKWRRLQTLAIPAGSKGNLIKVGQVKGVKMTLHHTGCYFGTSCLVSSVPFWLVVIICRQTHTHPHFFSSFSPSPFTADPHPPHALTNYRHSDAGWNM